MAANTGQQEPANESMASQSQENIKVAVRLRPFTEKEKQRQSKRIVDVEQNTVALYSPKYDENIKKFTFDYSYWSHDGFKRNQEGVNVPDLNHPNSSKYVGQERVFDDLGRFLLANALQGYNSALLAYGQTGSGKSYTVSGYGQNEGILPRFARELFAELDKLLGPAIENEDKEKAEAQDEATDVPPKPKPKTKPTPKATQSKDKLEHSEDSKSSKLQAVPKRKKRNRYEVYFSMIEIYNEVVRDLLAKQDGYQMNATAANSIARRGLRVREHPKRGFFVENLSSYPCASKEEIECLIEEGQLNKSIAATSMNETSSRGHTIYEFHIRQFRVKSSANEDADKKQHPAQQQEVETLTTSVVQLVDLAGSERMAVHVTGGELGARPASRSSSPFGQSGTDSLGPRVPMGRRPTPSASSSTSTTTLSNANQSGSRRIAQATGALSSQSLQVSNLLNSNHQQRFKESVSINQSLSALGNCIQVLSQFSQQQTDINTNNSKQPKIPYRDSVLTKLLNRCCLSGNSKVVLIATLSPADANYDDTLSTLRFADRAKQIRTHAVINRSCRGTAEQQHHAVNALQKENERLKQILDGRVTRSDDSSQTSNFDDSENMIDNFNGPKVATTGGSSTPLASSASKPAGSKSMDRNATITKARAITKAAGPTPGSNQQQQKPKNNLRLAQNNLTQSKRLSNAKIPSRTSSMATTSKGSGGLKLTAIKAGKLKESASNPSLAVDSEQMKQLVSSANKKMRQSTQDLSAPVDANGELELEEDEEGYDHDDQVLSQMRKSRSLGQGMAAAISGGTGNYDLADAGATPTAEEIELATGLLDEIDLNELANIIDDENLLSPDSDDSFNNGGGRTNFDENMSKEEKITIINRLLSNSSMAGKYIRKQLEQHEQQQSTNQKTPSGRMARPKRAGASLRNQRDANATTANATSAANTNELKKTNPYLSNLNPDEQLTGMISYIIQPGEMIVGKNGDCQLLVYGPGLRGQHAKLTRVVQDNDTKTSEVYIEPILPVATAATNEAAIGQQATVNTPKRVALMVNGEPVLKRIKLNHLDRVLFGSTAYFVFVDNEAAAIRGDNKTPNLGTSLDLITYDMAHQEVLRKIMSEAENEAMIKEINDYTHRPGTGKGRPARQATDPTTDELTHSSRDSSDRDNSKRSRMAHQNKHLARSLTIHDGDESDLALGPQSDTHKQDPGQQHQEEQQKSQLDRIKEEEDERNITIPRPHDSDPDLDELYRSKLMDDTYEFAMPITEANAIAKEMGIKVTYGLKILTGEEQLLLNETGACQLEDHSQDAVHLESEGQQQQQNEFTGSTEAGDYYQSRKQQSQDLHQGPQDSPSEENQQEVLISSCEPIKPSTLDLPPELYVHVHLDELGVDFYWSKEKFQERRIKMLELYGAWDVGGKSGLVEYLIEQSKYQGYYMIDPFIDDIKSTWVLIGHAQVTLQPVSHMSSLVESFDILDVNDELVGSVQIEALPCHQEPTDDPSMPYRVLEADELAKSFLKEPSELVGKKLVFLLKIVACSNVPDRFAQTFCQYTLNRDQAIVRTKITRRLDQQQHHHGGSGESSPVPNGEPQPAGAMLELDHEHFIVIDQLSQDVLDFLSHGFLTIQLVGQYKLQEADNQLSGGKSSSASTSAVTTAQSSSSQSSSAQSQTTSSQPTLVSTIISSINKYRFRMEQQSAGGGVSGQGAYQMNGSAHHHGLVNYSGGSIYANSLTDSAKSGNYHRTASSGMMMNNSNSGASSVTSASATINLFDQQNDDEEGINSLNGNSQENIIDMILTKRKLDRAENQLHYIKRTINIAEHYNKKHIPVRTVKKLLNSYGQEMEGGSLEEIATEVTTDSKSNNKHSNCVIQ